MNAFRKQPQRPLRWALSLIFLVAFSSVGCGGEPDEVASTTPAPAMPVVELAPTEEQLPVVEDFEAEAEEQITDENMNAELESLRKEIDAELK